MNSAEQNHIRFDIGRVLMAPFCAVFIIISLYGVHGAYQTPGPLNAFRVLTVGNALLVTGFYVLMVVAYLLRRPARMTSTSLVAKVIAVVATFLPFSLVLFQDQQHNDFRLLLLGSGVLMLGLSISVWSLFTLGKNLSLIPQARSLVQTGPYTYVRHPLYTGEILSAFGLVLSRFDLLGMLVPLVLVALQTYRAMQEEKILASGLPEYAAYMSRTLRFFPGVF